MLHFVDPDAARPYRRKNAPTFVVVLAELDDAARRHAPHRLPAARARAGEPVRDGEPVGRRFDRRSSSPSSRAPTPSTPAPATTQYFFKSVFSRVEPLASSRLVIGNEFTADLPDALRDGDDITRQITRAGERLAALDLLPAAFPIEEILSDRDLRHVKLLYGIGGLSYGNVSARRLTSARASREPQYWMSASGVDKSALHEIGRDILLVTGYDAERDVMQLRVPAGRRAAARVGRRDRALDDLPRAPRGGRDPPRARVDRGHRRHRDQLPVRHRRARRVGRRARAPGARPDAAPSSASATTASPSPATASTRSSPASTAGSSAKSPWTDSLSRDWHYAPRCPAPMNHAASASSRPSASTASRLVACTRPR